MWIDILHNKFNHNQFITLIINKEIFQLQWWLRFSFAGPRSTLNVLVMFISNIQGSTMGPIHLWNMNTTFQQSYVYFK